MKDSVETQPQAVVSRDEWRAARLSLLAQEKALTRARDALAAHRRALPWVRVEADYRFETEAGPRSLAELFEGRGQLIVYHFMFAPEDVAAGAVEYNYARAAFPVEDAHGASAFALGEGGAVYHTYSTYGRGLDPMLGAYTWLDIAPRGRDEDGLPWTMAWVRRHDRYDDAPVAARHG